MGFAARFALVIGYLRHWQVRGHWFPKALCFWHFQFSLLFWHFHLMSPPHSLESLSIIPSTANQVWTFRKVVDLGEQIQG